MPARAFQHINTRSANVEATKDFYVHVLGLREGNRPPFASTGYWLYLGDIPVVHLVQRPAGESAATGAGNLDHIAFEASDLDATRAALRSAGLEFREAIVPRDGTRQIFVHDPDGIRIELNFATE
jgi:catechol 2,3-dioxygenase-like lactoylglutathione lyase family enzyme